MAKITLPLPKQNATQMLQYLSKSKSQLKQDLFVLSLLDFKTNGFFVEFGATDGVEFSNSYLMEKEFGWSGIVAEPGKYWHHALRKNRECFIETACVWKDSDFILSFNEVNARVFSTINSFSDSDLHSETRKNGKTYDVETISLHDLLIKYDAPKIIDYLSIDTEGSEFEILNGFDFSKFSFRVITVEHNYTPMRKQIYDLLTKNGYERHYQDFSKFDDWYVKKDIK